MPERWRGGKIQTKTNLTQIYKNMPLDSYQQLRTVGALFTEKRQYIPVFTTIKTSFTYGHEEVTYKFAESYSDDRMSLKWWWKISVNLLLHSLNPGQFSIKFYFISTRGRVCVPKWYCWKYDSSVINTKVPPKKRKSLFLRQTFFDFKENPLTLNQLNWKLLTLTMAAVSAQDTKVIMFTQRPQGL